MIYKRHSIKGNSMIVIRVRLNVSPEHETQFVNNVQSEVENNKTLAGCLTYSLYKDMSQDNHFLIYEEWDSMASFDAYKNSDGFRTIMAALGPLLAGKPDSMYFDAEVVGP
ncbi:antibiotic biosynthesis monooxygenase [Marinomonas agarivorans]|nr:antibiotic biosynthesis monooxygenase [Marinomonas agarivorans]